jgi:uncharacterized protein
MTQTPWCPGRFVWWELYTSDIDKSKAFYESVVGWKIAPVAMGGAEYTMIHVGDQGIAGMVTRAPVFWMAYVSVLDVDAAAAATKSAGGTVLVEPVDVPPVGRFAAILDPQGAAVMLFKASGGDPPEVDRPAPGHFCWADLYTTDLAGAAAFYEKVIGWKVGPSKVNTNMSVFNRGERPVGGLLEAPEGVPPGWLNHVVVADLDAARRKAVDLGGRVVVDEIVPTIGRFSAIVDNVGAAISLFQSER